MIETFGSDAAEKPLANTIAVRRGWWRFDDSRPTTDRYAVKDPSKLSIVVSDEEPRSVVEGHCFAKLLSSPLVSRTSSDIEMNDLTAVEADDEEREHGTESVIVELKEIAGPGFVRMVLKECSPRLPCRSIRSNAPYVFLNRAFTDSETELEKFSSNSLTAPRSVIRGHPADQSDEVGRDPRLTVLLWPRT